MDSIRQDLYPIEKLKSNMLIPYLQDKILYKYVDLKTAKLILQNQNIRFTPPSDFNDPFELHKDLLIDAPNKDVIKELIKRNINLNRKDRRHIVYSTDKKRSVQAHNYALSKQKATMGVFCSSEVFDSTLMWSHYADKHKGICLGFKLPSIDTRALLFTLYVKYVENIVPHKIFNKGTIDDHIALLNWAVTKSKCWEYEKEIRTVCFIQNGLVPYGYDNLVEVHYGALTPENETKEIEKIIAEKKYNIQIRTKMKMGKNSFSLIHKLF